MLYFDLLDLIANLNINTWYLLSNSLPSIGIYSLEVYKQTHIKNKFTHKVEKDGDKKGA